MSGETRVSFVSLGCAKNVVDSEKMLGQLAEAGCAITADEDDAEVTVINTCGFLEASRTEADDVIREAVARKRNGVLKRVVVAGCLVQRDKETILERIKGVDALVGVNNRDDIVRAVLGTNGRKAKRTTEIYLSDYHPFTQLDTARLRITPRHYAYLRISEGCDQKCTFCTIPSIRGRMHCKPPEIVLAEARELVSDGAVEINLIGQDTTSYGMGDDQFDGGLAGLLRQLNTVDGLRWLRLMYVYPSVLSDEMIDAIAECEHVCKYVDVPLQHINDHILKAMHRRVDRAGTERLLQKIRDRIPGVAVRTTLIAGFPGETDDQVVELVDFLKAFRFDALGVFPYSLESETPAGRMSGQVPEAAKQERVAALMQAQQEVVFALADERVGREFEVLVDEGELSIPSRLRTSVDCRLSNDRSAGDGLGRMPMAIARHQGQAPSVDSVTYVESHEAQPGEFLAVRCWARQDYDLIARPTRVALPVLAR